MTTGWTSQRPLALIALGIVAVVAFWPVAAGASGGTDPPTSAPGATTSEPGATTSTTRAAESSTTGVVATLVAEGRPVVGATVEARRDGRTVATAKSAKDGIVRLDLEEAGQYEIRLVTKSLPDGVMVKPGARASLKPIVREGSTSPVVFQLVREGEAQVAAVSSFDRLLNLLASGTRFGLVIAVASIGLSLLFGTTGLTNFAHGELVAFGAFATWAINSGLGITLIPAAVLGTILSGLFGGSLELGLFRPLRRRRMPDLSVMVVSIGLAFVLRYLIAVIFEANPRQFVQYAAQGPSISLGSVDLRPKDIVVMVVALLVLVVVGLFLQRSRMGTAIRAVSDDRDLAESSGIDVEKVILTVWVLSGALAGLGGVLLASTDSLSWNMGQRILLIMFAAVVVGGLGTPFGAMAGGLLVGIVSDLSTFWLDADLKIVVALGALVVVLLFRPTGIFGVRVRAA